MLWKETLQATVQESKEAMPTLISRGEGMADIYPYRRVIRMQSFMSSRVSLLVGDAQYVLGVPMHSDLTSTDNHTISGETNSTTDDEFRSFERF